MSVVFINMTSLQSEPGVLFCRGDTGFSVSVAAVAIVSVRLTDRPRGAKLRRFRPLGFQGGWRLARDGVLYLHPLPALAELLDQFWIGPAECVLRDSPNARGLRDRYPALKIKGSERGRIGVGLRCFCHDVLRGGATPRRPAQESIQNIGELLELSALFISAAFISTEIISVVLAFSVFLERVEQSGVRWRDRDRRALYDLVGADL